MATSWHGMRITPPGWTLSDSASGERILAVDDGRLVLRHGRSLAMECGACLPHAVIPLIIESKASRLVQLPEWYSGHGF
jgi:hypothetical protein